jgi:hypothetical protein
VPSYLVETYLPRGRAGHRTVLDQQAREAAEKLTRERMHVRFERSIHIPEDEICFYVFSAVSAPAAALAAERAELDPIRVVEALSSAKEEQ